MNLRQEGDGQLAYPQSPTCWLEWKCTLQNRFPLESPKNPLWQRFSTLEFVRSQELGIGLAGLILDSSWCSHEAPSFSLPFFPICLVEAARLLGWSTGGILSTLFAHVFDLELVSDQQNHRGSSKGLWQSFLAGLPSRCQSWPMIAFISERFGNYLETVLFVLQFSQYDSHKDCSVAP